MWEELAMNWNGCELVEVIPGKVSGVPLVKGTRVPADVIVSNYEAGSAVEEIGENYPSVPMATIKALISFARSHELQSAS